jgi:hypothetical protein
MATEVVSRSNGEDQPDLAAELRLITEEATSLMVLGYQLRERIDAALGLLEPEPAPVPSPETVPPRVLREFGLEYLTRFSSQTIRRNLVERRGAQAATVLATKLSR